MLLTGTLNAGKGGKTPEIVAPTIRLAGDAMVDLWVPNEINVKHRPEVMSGFDLLSPGFHAKCIKGNRDIVAGAVLRRIEFQQVAEVFNHFIPHLQSHALLRNR